VQITSFGHPGGIRKLKTDALSEVVGCVETVSPGAGVIFVAALTPGIDHGNFYLFRNEAGLAHVMLHEHREHFARDPRSQTAEGNAEFLAENGEVFSVPTALTTSWDRGRAALLHWLPAQAHWPEFILLERTRET
jgi:hypothetical protein